MGNTYNYSIHKRKKANGRPLKSLLPTPPAQENTPEEKDLIVAHRRRLLKELQVEKSVEKIDPETWSGAPLDFLLLTGHITRRMHSTAISYTHFCRTNFYHSPQLCHQQWGEKLATFKRLLAPHTFASPTTTSPEAERTWKHINQQLTSLGVKSWLDKIGPDNNHQTLKVIVHSPSLLNRLKEALEYIEDPMKTLKEILTYS